MTDPKHFKSGYAAVNGLEMYYEIYGQGKPLVLIHGGGSTIQTSFGNLIPLLANRQIIAVELQAHGRTSDRNTDLTFEQDADDVARLLQNLGIAQASFLGYSNGGHTTIEIAIRHPALVDKIILAGTFYKREAIAPEFWDSFGGAQLQNMPKSLLEGYLAVNHDHEGLNNMFLKDVKRMKSFRGWSDAQMRSILAPVLVLSGSTDLGGPEHALEMSRIIPNCRLAILPGGHGKYLGATEALEGSKWTQGYVSGLIEEFLDEKA